MVCERVCKWDSNMRLMKDTDGGVWVGRGEKSDC